MDIVKTFSLFVMLTVAGMLYDRHLKKFQEDENLEKYNLIQKYLFNENTILNGKPIMWIHITYDINSRNWLNFMSKNSNFLNQSYKELCVESVIKHCGESFNICIIDDETFAKILPNWSVQMNKLAEPIKGHIRNLGLMKVLYKYGGMLMPSHFICMKNMKEIHNKKLSEKDCYVGEVINKTRSHVEKTFIPGNALMGCKKNNDVLREMITYLERMSSEVHNDYYGFESIPNIIYNHVLNNKVSVISGEMLGVKNVDGRPILLDDMMSTDSLGLTCNKYGILIDDVHLNNRVSYGWYINQSKKQVLESDVNISKYLLVSLNN